MPNDELLNKRADEIISQMTIEEKVSQLTNSAAGISRLSIKKYDWWNEALHGVARAGEATVFPQAIGMAAMWNPDFMREIGEAVSDEARAKYNKAQKEGNTERYFGLTFWSPNVNIFRDPRWGRGQETYGEDPYLTSRLGVAYIEGLQNNTGEHLKTAACAKHFAVHSGPESIRVEFDAKVSKKDMYETYLPAFEACVKEGHVEAVMGAYNRLNGVPCCCNKELLTDILRGKWGFGGHVVSDCGAIQYIHDHHRYTEDHEHSAAIAVKNGCDLNCGSVYSLLVDAYEKDLITEEEIDTALRHTLKTRIKLGMLGDRTEYDSIPYSVVACKKHKDMANEAARQSLVLLKNNILPLKKEDVSSVAVIGPNADSKTVLLGNYNGTPTEYHTVFKGFTDLLKDTVKVSCAKGSGFFNRDESLLREAVSLAAESDIAVLCMGLDAMMEGEDGEVSEDYAAGDRRNIEMPAAQAELIEEICKVNNKVILLAFCGGAVAFGKANELAQAIIHCWYPGEFGGKAIAEAVFGEYSPSGKLPVTFYESTSQLPDFSDYSMKNRTYKYFTGRPAYPFGFGLSYTSFKYSEPVITKAEGGIIYSVQIKNTGEYDAYETVKLYKSEINAVEQPVKSLAAFKKLFIEKGETESVEFFLGEETFSHIDENGEKEYLPSGKFNLFTE